MSLSRALRLPVRSLRLRLALLYSALFCASAVALGAVAEIFKPNFLVHSASQAAPRQHGQPAGCCVYSRSQSVLATVLHDASQNKAGVAMVLLLVILALGGGWLLAGRTLRPLRTITSSARAISASNLHQRLSLAGPSDEFAELGATLDELFGRLEALFEAQRRFVANASHELRTPLAAARTVLQVALADPAADPQALRSACQDALELGAQQERLIDALLTLATSERGIDEWQPFALAESLVANLVDNAMRHNLPGGEVTIATAILDGRAVLSVSNTGRRIPPGDVERIFQPFQRLGSDRVRPSGGHGLGLAIVRAIAGAHGATVAASARPEGGIDIEVSFP